MKKLILLFVIVVSNIFAQTNVFTDNFNSSQGPTFFTSGKIGTSNWDVNRSGNDFGARVNNGILELSNDATTTTNVAGWTFVNELITSISSPFSPILSSNTGPVTWTFNMRQIRTDPAGFTDGSYGVAFILGSTSQSPQKNGTGYAVVLGQSGSTDPIRLVKFSAGLQSLTNLISSNTSGLADFGNDYLSIKITYNPTSNTWELFVRNDGTSAFNDPLSGTLISQGIATDNTYTSTLLSYFGAYWQGSTSASQTAFFDNLNISVTLPSAPSAPVALPATNVTQTGFTAKWNSTAGAIKYYLDVSTQNDFSIYVTGYENKEIIGDTLAAVSGLNPSTNYFYRVRANNASGTSGNSNIVSVTTLANQPSAPVALPATNITQTGFTAKWSSSIGATKYYLDISTQNDFSIYVTGYENKEIIGDTLEVISSLNPSTNYFYRVRANNASGTSGNSNTISVTTLANVSTAGIIVNEWSQGSSGAKEWVELLVVQDNLNIQNYKLIDENNSLSISFTGAGFNNIRKGSLIVIYNGGDVDGLITSDLNYDGTTDKNLVISSLNNSGTWSLTRTTGWNSTTGVFSNSTNTDIPKILDASSNLIFTTPKFASSNQIAYFTEDSEQEATIETNWLTSTSSNGTPGQPNGGNNTTWIITTLATSISSIPNSPIATNASNITQNSFTANWNSTAGATKYFLDVATDNTFSNYVSGYENLDVGNNTSANITGLNPLTNYYYRVRANNSLGTSGNSNTVQVTTLTNQTTVQFITTSGSVYENAGTYNLIFSINNPSASLPTTFDVVVTGGTGSFDDINNYTTQTITFPAGSSSNKSLQINLNNDGIAEGNETIIFNIQNVTGGNSAIAGTNNTFTLTINDPIADYYSSVNTTLNGQAFKTELHNLIKGHTAFPYSSSSTDVWDILMDAYEDPANSSNVILIYTGRSQAKTYNSSTAGSDPNAWNREHVFAQSRGGFSVNNASDNPGVATDAHNLAPEDASVNSDRGNKDFDIGGSPHPEAIGSFMDADSFEPRDAVKGDIARILFYMDVRYEGDNGELQLELQDGVNTTVGTIGKLSTLLLWHQQDPPDAFEIARNNRIYNYQGNKNPFIDHPEWVSKIYGSNSAPTISNISRNLTVPDENQNLVVSANIIDDGSVSSAQVIYTINNGVQQFSNMTLSNASLYTATIPETAYGNGDLLEYKIKAVDNESNERISESYKVFTGITPISTLHQVNASGVLTYNGIYSKVRGIATVPNGLFSSSNLEVNIQDNTGGIVVYKVTAGSTPFVVGKNYTVSGSLTQYNGLAELVPNNVSTDIIDNGPDTEVQPTVKTFAELIANPEQYEGMLIKVKNVNKISGTWAASQNLTVTDGTSSDITIRVSSGTNLASNPEPAWPKDVVGIFTQFDSSSPYTGDYQLKPRSISDIQNVTISNQPTQYIVTTSNYNPTVGSTITINAQLSDVNGNPVSTAGKVITWNSTNGGSFSSATSVTNANGLATVDFTVVNQSNVNHVVSVSDNSTPQLTGQSNIITTKASAGAGFIVTVSDENPVAGSEISVNAQLVDIFNNPVTTNGVLVNWSSTNGGSFSSNSSLTNTNGIASVNFTANTKSDIIHVINVNSGTAPNQIFGNSNQILTKAGNPIKYLVNSNDYNPTVNTQIFINAQLVDVNNNPVKQAGKIVNWLSTGDGNFSQTSSITNAFGIADVILTTSKKSNNEHLITASDNDGLYGISNLIKTKAGQPSKLIINADDLFPSAGSEINVSCQLADEFDNHVSNIEYVINWSASNNGQLKNQSTILDQNGFSTNKLKVSSKAGDNHFVNVNVINNQNISGISKEIKVVAANGIKYLIKISNNNPFVGNSIEVEAQLVDEFNNLVASEGNVINWSSTNGGSFKENTSLTDVNGKAKNIFIVSSEKNVKHVITALDNNSRSGNSEEITTKSINSPILISPGNNSKNISLEFTFSWNNVINIDGYEFQLSNENDFNNLTVNQFVKDNSIKVSSLELEKKYFWRVRAKKENGYSDWSAIWNFTTLPNKPMKPGLLMPVNNSVNQNVKTQLKWQKIENAEKYLVQLSDNQNFTKILFENNNLIDAQTTTNGLLNLTKYYWRVKAVNQTGESDFSDVWNFTTIDTIIAPSNFTAYVDTNANVVLNWKDNSNNENGFKLERFDEGGIDFYQFDQTKENIQSYIVNNLSNGKTYKFRIRAFNNSTFSDYTNILQIKIPNSTLKAPSNLKAQPDKDGYILLTWNDNSNDELGFVILKQNDLNLNLKAGNKETSSSFVAIDTVKPNTTEYLDKSTKFGVKYLYQVAAFNQSGISLPAQLKNEIMPLQAPTDLKAQLSNEFIQIQWKDNSNDETEFVLQRATKPKMEYEVIAKVQANNTTYTDSKVIDGKKYFYNVYAITNNVGLSAFSNIDSVYIKMKPPTNLVAKQLTNQNKIQLEWKDNSQSEHGYIIERKEISNINFDEIYTTQSNVTNYVDEMIINKKNYIYRIKGFNENGFSDYSNENSILVGIEKNTELPTVFKLEQNFPNPFNPTTTIKYTIPAVTLRQDQSDNKQNVMLSQPDLQAGSSKGDNLVTLKIYDVLGNEVATLVNERKSAGIYEVKFNASKLSSGVYLIKLQAGSLIQTRKMLLLK